MISDVDLFKKLLMEEYDIDRCREELARANFVHVNDDTPHKEFSDRYTSAILYHLEQLKMDNQELKSKVLRLLAYLTAFTKMCEKCCYPKTVCQCRKEKKDESKQD